MDVEKPGEALSRKQGNEFITLSAAETGKLRAIGDKARARWVADMKKKGIDGAALIRDAEAMLARHRK
jgi:hypothetical protein